MDGQKDRIPSRNDFVGWFYEKRHVFFRYIHCFDPNMDTAEEVFQEACLRFLTVSGSFPDYAPAAKYLRKIIFTLIVGRRRRDRRLLFLESPPELVCEPEPVWQKDMLLKKLHRAIGSLSLRDRRLMAVYLLPGLLVQERSKLLNLPLSTYRYRVNRIISKLRKQLLPKNRYQESAFYKPIGGN